MYGLRGCKSLGRLGLRCEGNLKLASSPAAKAPNTPQINIPKLSDKSLHCFLSTQGTEALV